MQAGSLLFPRCWPAARVAVAGTPALLLARPLPSTCRTITFSSKTAAIGESYAVRRLQHAHSLATEAARPSILEALIQRARSSSPPPRPKPPSRPTTPQSAQAQTAAQARQDRTVEALKRFGQAGQGGSSPGGGSNPIIQLINRIRPDILINTIILLNFLVFLSWKYAETSYKKFDDPSNWVWMCRNFLSGEQNLKEGRWWTMITCAFSQSDTGHLFMNMVSLAFMGIPVARFIRPAATLLLYLSAGVVASVTSMSWNKYFEPNKSRGHFSHGASGSVFAITTVFACLRPTTQFLLFFVVPVPAWACVSGLFVWDFYNASYRTGGKTDSAGHVGGILAGLAYFLVRLRGRGL